MAFLDVEAPEKRAADGKSFQNATEARLAVEIVKRVLRAGLSRSGLGVITPYAAQVRLIFDLLSRDTEFQMVAEPSGDGTEFKEESQLGFSISSVDGFQGREKDLIIFSTVRSNPDNRMGFLKDWRRLNVALSRARRGIIVIGNRNTLQNDSHWKDFFSFVDATKLVVHEDDMLMLSESAPSSRNTIVSLE